MSDINRMLDAEVGRLRAARASSNLRRAKAPGGDQRAQLVAEVRAAEQRGQPVHPALRQALAGGVETASRGGYTLLPPAA